MSDRIAVVVGSLRHGSFTRRVAEAMVRLAPGAYAYEFLAIGQLALYNQDVAQAFNQMIDHQANSSPRAA